MAFGVWLPFSPMAPAIHLQPLPGVFSVYVPLVLLVYCALTQLVKVLCLRRFQSWL